MKRENDAYYTDAKIVSVISEHLPKFSKNEVKILEPSVGEGAFLPAIFNKYNNKKISLDIVDVDNEILRNTQKKYRYGKALNVDFLQYNFRKHYDLVIGNPPFSSAREFLEKSLTISDYVIMVLPKIFLSSEKYRRTREFLENFCIEKIIDLKENGFSDVKIETICIYINLLKKPNDKQKYFTDKKYPYWLIYRNEEFDKVSDTLRLNIFNVFRDRDLKNQFLKDRKTDESNIWVIRSKNITENGLKHIEGYDRFISKEYLLNSKAIKFLNREVFVAPNLSEEIRVIKKPKNVTCNGSVAMLVPKELIDIKEKDLKYFSSDEFKSFYEIATNKSTRSKNIDKNTIYFFGVKK